MDRKCLRTKKEDVREVISRLYHLSEMIHDGEYQIKTKSGRNRIWDFHSMTIGNLPDGRAVAMSVAVDVTERVLMDNQLKESEQRFQILHNASFGGLAIHDQGIILECNQGLSDITGYSLNELTGMDGLLLIAPDYRAFVMEKITSGYEKPYEAYGVRKDKEIYPLRLEARNLPYQGNKFELLSLEILPIKKRAEKRCLIVKFVLKHYLTKRLWVPIAR